MAFDFLKKLFGTSSNNSSSRLLSEAEIDKKLLYADCFTSYNSKGVAIFQMKAGKTHLVESNLEQSLTACFVYFWLRKTSSTNNNIYNVLMESLAGDVNISKEEKVKFLNSCFNIKLEMSNPNIDKLYLKGRGIINLIATMLPYANGFAMEEAPEIVKFADSRFGPTAEIKGNVMISPKELATIIIRDMQKGLLRIS